MADQSLIGEELPSRRGRRGPRHSVSVTGGVAERALGLAGRTAGNLMYYRTEGSEQGDES